MSPDPGAVDDGAVGDGAVGDGAVGDGAGAPDVGAAMDGEPVGLTELVGLDGVGRAAESVSAASGVSTFEPSACVSPTGEVVIGEPLANRFPDEESATGAPPSSSGAPRSNAPPATATKVASSKTATGPRRRRVERTALSSFGV